MSAMQVAFEDREPQRPAASRRMGHMVATLALALATGCTFGGGATDLSPTDSDDRAVGRLPEPDAISVVAFRALANGETEWVESVSGAVGTVEGRGVPDGLGCLPAELTIHDFSGLRIEERRLCRPSPGI